LEVPAIRRENSPLKRRRTTAPPGTPEGRVDAPARGCLAQEETNMRDKSKGVDGKKRRKKKPPELKETKKR